MQTDRRDPSGVSGSPSSSAEQSFLQRAPAISLPKGGGAIHGIGEKFGANPVTGSASVTIPIFASPGRSGFGPELALTYDSGAGNGPFGLGWALPLPAITRKTDKGLPRYRDDEESDVFMLGGSDDLVPFMNPQTGNTVARESSHRRANGQPYLIDRYRPRVEGSFALIERWTHEVTHETHWRTISRENVTTIFGDDAASRVADRSDPRRVYQWLVSRSYDDKGNLIRYAYKPEDYADIPASRLHERNRDHATPGPQRYLKHICYGNVAPYLPDLSAPTATPLPELPRVPADAAHPSPWLFQLTFDYGDHDLTGPTPAESTTRRWRARTDPFSTYRPGFEVRTHRLCERALMFHHFSELGAEPCLVRSTDFRYEMAGDSPDPLVSPFSFLNSAWQTGYQRDAARTGGYRSALTPPVDFTYSRARIGDVISEVDAESIENMPVGIGGPGYQFVDLDGEGLAGVLTEQGGAWYYKPSLGDGRFDRSTVVLRKPSFAALTAGRQQLMDLAGDGELDLVELGGPMPGFQERPPDGDWDSFTPFASLPNIAWDDADLRLIDLTGDGLSDVLLTERDVFTWYPGAGEEGFEAAECVRQPRDEEDGPRLIFADGTQTIFTADMSGDGLHDLVRIRNGQICYWANEGYGRFGAKVTMDRAPWFDQPELFDPRRIRLADVDGSGPTDIIYLGSDAARLYVNRSGNALSDARALPFPVATGNLAAVQVADLLGNGTACLVWSSALPADARHPVRYLDLMGGQKPHLLTRLDNNLGAETTFEYAPSTKFYLADKRAGRPWLTRLPFPVHCLERVTAVDHWRHTSFSTRYSYHHGYFDGLEREFRGFGRVEQVDVESFGTFAAANVASPYVTSDHTLYQPPVKTITWFHTGAAPDSRHIMSHFEREYFPASLAALPNTAAVVAGFAEKEVAQPELHALRLTPAEWREAARACKGMVLRQEVYELDVDALNGNVAPSKQIPVRIFSAMSHGYRMERLQPQGDNLHAVWMVMEHEVVSYEYELDLRPVSFAAAGAAPPALLPDPRVAHTLHLSFDELGNVQQSVAVGYGRSRQFDDPDLADQLALIRAVQSERHVGYTETQYTASLSAIDPAAGTTPVQYYRLRVPCDVQTFELTGFSPQAAARYFTHHDFLGYDLSALYRPPGPLTLVKRKAYQQLPTDLLPTMRIVEHARTLFFADDPAVALTFLAAPLPLGTLGRRGLTYESYKLALSDALLDAVLTPPRLAQPLPGGPSVRQALRDGGVSGYLSDADATQLFGVSAAGEYWMRSGVAGFASHAADHFFLPESYRDPFGHTTTLAYDARDLFVQSSTDALGNTTTATQFDYRVLAPTELQDINANRTEICHDVLGRVAALAVKGKGTEGDTLTAFDADLANPSLAVVMSHFDLAPLTPTQARDLFTPQLGGATTRYLYHFGEAVDAAGVTSWATRPAGACAIMRERHVATLAAGAVSDLQLAFACSDGQGSVLMTRSQAEPAATGGVVRWIVSGKTIVNNKGKPVKQYEPYFSSLPRCCAEGDAHEEVGVTPIMFYDAPGRLVRTELPDGTLNRVEFSPWQVTTFDANDTVTESSWYTGRNAPPVAQPLPVDPMTGDLLVTADQRAAWLSAQHAGTPSIAFLDSLGRTVVNVVHDRVEDANGALLFGGKRYSDVRFATYTKLDAEGKPLWIRDARRNLVMQYITPSKATRWDDEPNEAIPIGGVPAYDIAGNLLFQRSADAGDRWMINDAAGKAFVAWDSRGDTVVSSYDELHRPTTLRLINADHPSGIIVQFAQYAGRSAADIAANRCGMPWRGFDQGGLMTNLAFDFKGNPTSVARRVARDTTQDIEWSVVSTLTLAQEPNALLEPETFTQTITHDALNRVVRQYNWHRAGQPLAVYESGYDARGMLARETITVGATALGTGHTGGTVTVAIAAVTRDAKGQRQRLELGNGVVTQYQYDPATFRLASLITTRPARGELQRLSFAYDPVGNVTDVIDGAIPVEYFANAMIEPRKRYAYDALYRLVEATGREHAGQVTYDARDLWNDCPFRVDYGAANHTAWRTYTQRYRYDGVGNILEMKHVTGTSAQSWTRRYQYARDSNRLLATGMGTAVVDPYPAAGPALQYRYGYNAHGSMASLPHLPQMDWDATEQLRHLARLAASRGTDPAGCPDTSLEAWYRYNALRDRVRKRVVKQGGLVEDRWYLGGVEWFRRTRSGALVEEIETLHVLDGQQRVLMVDQVRQTDRAALGTGTRYRYALADHLGSTTVEVDENADVISHEEYHPYGTTSYQSGPNAAEVSLKRYRYTGMERDDESGLEYHGARYYASWLGRWTSPDPSFLSDGVNLWSYVSGRPTHFVDPTGENETDPALRAKELLARYGSRKGTGYEGIVPSPAPLNNLGLGTKGYEMIAQTGDLGRLATLVTNISLGFAGGEVLSGLAEAYTFFKGVAITGGFFGAAASGVGAGEALTGRTITNEKLEGWDRFETGTYATVGLISLGTARAGQEKPISSTAQDRILEFVKIPGEETSNASPGEVKLYQQMVVAQTEISVSELEGAVSPAVKVGGPRNVSVSAGPKVKSTLHGHPVSKVAKFSKGDFGKYLSSGKYKPDTKHSVLGAKWPQTSAELVHQGKLPVPLKQGTIVKTTIVQKNVPVGKKPALAKVRFPK